MNFLNRKDRVHLILDGERHPPLYPGGVGARNGEVDDHTEVVPPAPPAGPEDGALVERLLWDLLAGPDHHWRHPAG